MEKLNKNWTTKGVVYIAAAMGAASIWLIFIPSIRSAQDQLERSARVLEGDRALLARKPALESEWESKRIYFQEGQESDEILNNWVKDLLASAQSQALIMEKLEPTGIKTGPEGRRLTVFLSFQGDILKFVRFIYQIIEKDPLSRVESFGMRQEDTAKGLNFELMLAKAVK